MKYHYQTKNVCSKEIILDIDTETNMINNLKVIGGCDGNLKGISSLVSGMKIDDVINKLEGIQCGFKNTSCPDQIAQALKQYCSERKNQ